MSADPRYPYTYACDYIREIVGMGDDGSTKISRADASQIRVVLADIAGLDDEEMAKRIADRFLETWGKP